MSSYFSGRNGYNGSKGPEKRKERTTSSAGSAYMNANAVIESAVDKRDKSYDDAAKGLAQFIMGEIKDGASSVKNVSEQLDKLLRQYNAEEKARIYEKAIAFVIVNS